MKRPNSPELERYESVLADLGVDVEDLPIAAELLQTVVKLSHDKPGRAEMKLLMRSFKELRYAFKIFKPYRSRRKVSMFGSARTPSEHPNYQIAKEFGKICADAGFMVITGAGGGIMAAGHEGAGLASSFGVAIRLPFEQTTNTFIAGDEKLIHFRYFFSRKLVFVKETHAIALFPGGFGTHDEGFEVLTLVQTGRCDPLPIVLCAAKGDDYWHAWDNFVRKQLIEDRLVSPEDTSLYFITDDPQTGVDHIRRFYRNYHSLRYTRDHLILRIQHAPSAEELENIRTKFADIVTDGTFEVRSSGQCHDDPELVPHMPRLCFHFNRRNLSRLRQLIDVLNLLPSLPPAEALAASQVGAHRSDRNVAEIAEEESIKIMEPKSRSK
jgi:uncharacterized protein (TIGR00730 family)